jgi:hypothetical protein
MSPNRVGNFTPDRVRCALVPWLVVPGLVDPWQLTLLSPTWFSVVVSSYTGFNLSIETLLRLFLICNEKYLGFLANTLYGPS